MEKRRFCWDLHRLCRSPVALPFALLCISLLGASAEALELQQTSTQARYVAAAEVQPYVDLNFGAEIRRVTTSEGDLVASWTGSAVMGVQPTPFQLFIPADCLRLVAGSLQVRNYRACGVKATVSVDRIGPVELRIHAFTATLTQTRGGFARLSINAAIGGTTAVGDLSSSILGSLGGASQTVRIGSASASLLPNSIEVLGFNPQPEPPP